MTKSVDQYIANHKQWQVELKKIRKIILKSSFIETIKWGSPVYTVMDKNLIGMGAFKNYFETGLLTTMNPRVMPILKLW